jgi:hypothetical protein
MIEMRWFVPVEGERRLQYRQQIDVTVRAGIWPADSTSATANMQWSQWRDVPLVAERDPGFP